MKNKTSYHLVHQAMQYNFQFLQIIIGKMKSLL